MIIYKKVQSKADMEETFRLRFRVACQERLLEPEESYPSGRVHDVYDDHSVHVIARHFDLIPIGTLSLVHGHPIGLPVEKTCGITIPDKKRSGELSKLSISKVAIGISGARQRDVLMGLLRVLCLEGTKMGIDHWYMVLTKSMHRLLCGYGIRPLPLHGTGACREGLPYRIRLRDLERPLFLEDVPAHPSLHPSAPSSRRAKPPHGPTVMH